MNRHVFILGSCYPAELGGPSNTIFNQAKVLVESGLNVIIYSTTFGLNDELKNRYKIKPNKVAKIKGVDVIFFEHKTSSTLSRKMLSHIIKDYECKNIYHLSSVFYPQNLLVFLILIVKKINYTIGPRGELFEPALNVSKIKKQIFRPLIKTILKNAKRIVVTSNYEALSVSKYLGYESGDQVIKVLPNYLELPKPSFLEKKNYILYLGRINEYKCIDRLIYSYYKAKVNERFELIIAGHGCYKYIQDLKKIVLSLGLTESVRFLGHVTGREKFSLYEECHCFVLPSHSENFGNVVLEALSQRSIVVACHNSPWALLAEHECGYFVANTVDELTRVINECCNLDIKELESKRETSYQLYIDNFDIINNKKNIIDTYEF